MYADPRSTFRYHEFPPVLTSIFTYFFSTERPTALVINLVIAAVTVAFLALLWRTSRTTKREMSGLSTLRQRLGSSQTASASNEQHERSGSVVTSIAGDADAVTRDQLVREATLLQDHSPLVASRVRNLAALHRRGDDIDQDALAAVVVSQLDRTTMAPKWATNAVVLLGLTGTLIGLSTAVQSAGGLLHAGTSATISDAIAAVTATFDGVKVAFSATLLGAVAAVLLSGSVARVRWRQALFLQRLEELTAVELIPLFSTTPGLALATAARRLTEMESDLQTGLQLVIASLVEQGATLEQRLLTLSERIRHEAEELLGRFDESSRSLARLTGTNTKASLSDALATLQASSSDIQSVLSSAATMIPNMEESIARHVDQQTADINVALSAYTSQFASGVDRQTSAIMNGMQRFDDLIPSLAETIARGVDQQTADINAALHTYTAEQRQQTSGNASQLQEIHGLLVSLDRAIAQFDGTIRTGSSALTAEHTAVLAAIADLKQLRTDLSASLVQLPEAVAKVVATQQVAATAPFRGPAPSPRTAPPLTAPRAEPDGRSTATTTGPVAAEGRDISTSPTTHTAAAPRSDSQNLFRRWFSGK